MSNFQISPLNKRQQDDKLIYQFNPIYSWILIICLILLILSFILQNELFSLGVYTAFFVYFGLKVTLGTRFSKEIKLAVKEDRAEVIGNKYSFSHPLCVVVKPKQQDTPEVDPSKVEEES